MKILIAGVPFGRNNVGDEAILETVIQVVRELKPDADLTVSTDDGPATAEKLGVRTVELFGFEPPYSQETMRREIEAHDVYLWAGATGLSDYPEVATRMCRIAQQAGRKSVVWNVGMNDELNPAKYRLNNGRKRKVLSLLSALTGGTWDGVAWWQNRAEARARRVVKETLDACDLVVVRDPESRDQVLRCGVTNEVVVGADTALVLQTDPAAQFNSGVNALLQSERPRFGLCVSAQRRIAGTEKLVALLDRIIAELAMDVLFIPMNPITDAQLMSDLHSQLAPEHREHAALLDGRREPGEVLALSQHLSVVASSRLHLLILSSIHHIPLIGISRGSKVDNFLAPYDLKAVGSVESCDFDAFFAEVARLVREQSAFQERSKSVRSDLLQRLDTAKAKLAAVLT